VKGVLPAVTILATSFLPAGQSLASTCPTKEPPPSGGLVTIARTGQGFQLERNGKPYPIRGACAWDHLAELKAAGGNSVRTWGSKDDPKLYDEAYALGLSVCAGLWFDWVPERPEYMRRQFEAICSHVRSYKDHPAILMWGIGNEYEVGVTEQHCPSLDALGVNSYGGLQSLPPRLREYGWDKPYLVTEFGEAGPRELGKTAWGAPIETNSTYVAEHWIGPGVRLLSREMEEGRCLGSYVYLWGVHRQFGPTATWYHLFLDSGERVGGGDAVIAAWSGGPPANRAPEIVSFHASAGLKEVPPGSRHDAEVQYHDPDGDPVEIRWEILAERPAKDASWPARYPACIVQVKDGALVFTAPEEPGAYRLYVYVLDGEGGAATANLSFFVSGKTDAGAEDD
jgi:hypothetical protein